MKFEKNGYHEDSDVDDTEEFRFPTLTHTREDAVRKLHSRRDERFIEQMLVSLDSWLENNEEDDCWTDESPDADEPFDLATVMSSCLSSWRSQYKSVSNHVMRSKQNRRDGFFTIRSGTPASAPDTTKVRRDSRNKELNQFLDTVQAQLNETSSEVEMYSKQKKEFTKQSPIERPSQLLQLQVSNAGTAEDDLRDARNKVLSKLSKSCANWITNRGSIMGEPRYELHKQFALLEAGAGGELEGSTVKSGSESTQQRLKELDSETGEDGSSFTKLGPQAPF